MFITQMTLRVDSFTDQSISLVKKEQRGTEQLSFNPWSSTYQGIGLC